MLSPCLFNFHAVNIVKNARLDELQAGIEIVERNIQLRQADNTTLMEESEEKLKGLFIRVKEEREKVGCKSALKKNKTKLRSQYLVPSLHGKQKWKKWKQ